MKDWIYAGRLRNGESCGGLLQVSSCLEWRGAKTPIWRKAPENPFHAKQLKVEKQRVISRDAGVTQILGLDSFGLKGLSKQACKGLLVELKDRYRRQ
jgi:hypothetical protein